jgi:hypothetical protein
MTETATTTTEGQAASDTTTQSATGADGQGQQQQTEGQPAAEGAADTGKTEEAKKPEGAPEKYEFANTDQLDSAVLNQFSEVARDLNLSQEAAQQVLDKMGPVIASRQSEQLEQARNQWAEDAKADKEFGGEKLQENLSYAKKAMETFATPELRALLNESGLGNHPEIIRVFVRAGKAISEDRLVTGAQGTTASASDPKRLYPNSNMN